MTNIKPGWNPWLRKNNLSSYAEEYDQYDNNTVSNSDGDCGMHHARYSVSNKNIHYQ